MHVIAAKGVAFREALEPSFFGYQEQVVANARAMADGLLSEGMKLISGGTDNHLVLVDLSDTEVTGKDAEQLLDSVGITANKNSIPADPRKPWITSGLRLGSPAGTTRGLGLDEFRELGRMIAMVCKAPQDENILASTRARVAEMCDGHPLYPDL
jgi:glycine hydroxymethyltransferase